METIDTIKQRRAVREYTDAPIESSTIERLIGAAILAPSAQDELRSGCSLTFSRLHSTRPFAS